MTFMNVKNNFVRIHEINLLITLIIEMYKWNEITLHTSNVRIKCCELYASSNNLWISQVFI